jgi:predicted DNA-binding protein (UPF0251 family)
MTDVFKPRGIPAKDLEEVLLPIEGFEALRLRDLEKLDQETAAACMNVSRQTFGRVLAEARELTAEALVMGKMIKIQGGDYTFPDVCIRDTEGGNGQCCRHRTEKDA